MIHKQLIGILTAVLAGQILSSCASSERMTRMSGILGSYEKPRKERISHYSAHTPEEKLSPLDDSLINLWPFFYRNNLYTSVLWPMIDSDPYGFAVRPFYNQEGNEYSILFPFCAWNPVNGDGWLANTYWNRNGFGAVPIFHSPQDPKKLAYYTLFWRSDGNWGVFPFARFGNGINTVTLAWWCRDTEKDTLSGGLFPLARFSTNTRTLSYAGPFWFRKKMFGLFPVFKYDPEKISYAGPFWKDSSDQTFGLFPLFRYRKPLDHFFFPLYSISRNGKCFFSPIAAWNGNKMISILGPMYISTSYQPRRTQALDPMFATGNKLAERSFRMIGLLGYAGHKTVFQWKKECDLRYLNFSRMDLILNHRPYLAYQLEKLGYKGPFPENKTELNNLKKALRKDIVRQENSYFGFFPLFHRESSPSEQILRVLFFLPCYKNAPGREKELSLLGPLLFRWKKTETPEPRRKRYGQSKFFSVDSELSSLELSLLLLGRIQIKTFYAESAGLEILRKLSEASGPDEEKKEIDRERISAELRKVDPSLTLPESVEDKESLRAFLVDMAGSWNLPVRTKWSGGFFPLFLKTEADVWLFPALLSGFSKQEDTSTFLSIPLLSMVKNGTDEKIRCFLYPFGWKESEKKQNRDDALICEADDILDNRSYVRKSGLAVLLGLYHQNENSVLAAVNKGEAERLNKLRSLLWKRIRRLNELARVKAKISLQRSRLEKSVTLKTGKTLPLNDADACGNAVSALPAKSTLTRALRNLKEDYHCAAALREILSDSQKELNEILEKLEISPRNFNRNSRKELQACFDSLYNGRIRECSVKSTGTWFARYAESENTSRWNIAWILAEGSASGDREEMRILRYLYRYRRNGDQSEMLLPFFSLQKKGADRRISLFWRLWERRIVNGKVSGHICFIPFGEEE